VRPRDDGPLLAVDLGLRTGLAVYDAGGRPVHVASRHLGGRRQLRGMVRAVLAEHAPAVVLLEGDRELARVWHEAAERAGARSAGVTPETWRPRLLHPSERRDGARAKAAARRLAPLVLDWGGLRIPSRLRTDAAEAVLIGLWGVLTEGWLAALPPQLDPRRRPSR
jgi:hypothetical protein